jgi:hypothetical protein
MDNAGAKKMIENAARQGRKNLAVVEKIKRPPVLPPLEGSTQAAVPQPTDVKIDGDSVAVTKGGEFSPGKDPDFEVLVASYASEIGENWQRGVDAFMTVARLCAEASAQMTPAERAELVKLLPFGDSAFSKFAQIGNDERLSAPELRRLLPPHYTTTYAITLLSDQELRDAIADKVIRPDMNRAELQKWRNAYRELRAPSLPVAASDSAVVSPPTVPTNSEAVVSIACPADVPVQPHAPDDLEIPPFLDRRNPAKTRAQNDAAFGLLQAAWDKSTDLKRAWANAPAVVRDHFIAVVLRTSVT